MSLLRLGKISTVYMSLCLANHLLREVSKCQNQIEILCYLGIKCLIDFSRYATKTGTATSEQRRKAKISGIPYLLGDDEENTH